MGKIGGGNSIRYACCLELIIKIIKMGLKDQIKSIKIKQYFGMSPKFGCDLKMDSWKKRKIKLQLELISPNEYLCELFIKCMEL